MLHANVKITTLVCAVYCFPISAAAEPLATATSYDPPIARLIVGLLLCVFLAYAVIHVLRNVQSGRGVVKSLPGLKLNRSKQHTTQITVLETHRLNATSDVCLISWKQEEFLVIVGPHAPKLLKENGIFMEDLESLGGSI